MMFSRTLCSHSLLAVLAVSATLAMPSRAQAPVMRYDQLMKAMAQANQTAVMQQRLAGKVVQLKLKSSGPQLLVVSAEDGVMFACETRARAFKGGQVTSQIRRIEDTAEGNFLVTLADCR